MCSNTNVQHRKVKVKFFEEYFLEAKFPRVGVTDLKQLRDGLLLSQPCTKIQHQFLISKLFVKID